ncbi:hypothetical protein LWI28_017612 [Acer negundo]|uniref:RRM domain-containing protein n=1 Tax=Acer negundo TaxID=4023 RepID=A0AAD5IAM7_ACENE|nr:hypothetical protein LWI28_017612 [Acer negundo]
MAGKEDFRIFVGGLSYGITERQLENEFNRFGKIIESQMGFLEIFLVRNELLKLGPVFMLRLKQMVLPHLLSAGVLIHGKHLGSPKNLLLSFE